jgi:hypothetical protein
MKSPNLFKILSAVSMTMLAANVVAQPLSVTTDEKQKIRVELTITPATFDFRIGVNTIEGSNDKIRLWVSNGEGKKCTASLSDAEGVLWSRSFRDAWFSQSFDLSALDDGAYLLSVTNGREVIQKKITLTTDNVVKKEVVVD